MLVLVRGRVSFPYVGPRFYQPMFEAVFEVGGVLSACINPAVADCDPLESVRKASFQHRMSYKYPLNKSFR